MANDMNRSRRSFLKGASVAGVLGLAGCLDQSAGGDGDGGAWTLGTSSEGSSSFAIGSNWTEYASQNDALDFEVDAVITEGTGASYRRMDRGDFELSGTTTQLLAASPTLARTKTSRSRTSITSVRFEATWASTTSACTTQTRSTAGTTSGSSVAISSAGSGTRPPVEWLVDQEVGMDNIDARYMAFADMPAAMRSGQIDAMFTWTVNKTNPQGAFQEVDATVNWEPLPISEATRDKLQNDLAYLTYVQLDEDTVAQNTENYSEPLDTFTLTYLYVAKADRDDDRIYDITKFTYENGDELVDRDSVMGYFPDPDQFMGQLHPDIPVHKGAYDYYTEEGLWEDYDLTPPPEA